MDLIGFPDSVFTRAARMGLHALGRDYTFVAVNPFSDEGRSTLSAHSPFGRVPVLVDGGFSCYETPAILRSIGDNTLFPNGKRGARVLQVAGIVQSDLYWPLVRQVFAHGFYRPLHGEAADPAQVQQGLAAAPRILGALEHIAAEGLALDCNQITAADCVLAPMLAAFTAVPEGAAILHEHRSLNIWQNWINQKSSFIHTTPPWAEDT